MNLRSRARQEAMHQPLPDGRGSAVASRGTCHPAKRRWRIWSRVTAATMITPRITFW